jgi:hypothetical protein
MLVATKRSNSVRRFLGTVLALLVGATFLAITPSPARAVDLVDVTVTIMRFQALDDPDPAPFQGVGDYFALVVIGAVAQNNNADQIESQDISPYWTFTASVDRDASPTTTVLIRILDDDDFPAAPDDIMDIDPDDNDLDLVLTLDLTTGNWSGDGIGSNVGFGAGDGDTEHSGIFEGGERGRLWFDISLSSNGDLDGDGIPDGVERFGIRDDTGALTTDMAALGADPCRPTVAIEIDYLDAPDHDHQPDPAAIQEAVDAFNAAPIAAVASCPYAGFPTQPSGANLIVDVDDAINVTTAQDESNWDIAKLDAQRASDFDPDREPYFFYNIWAHTHDGTSSSGVCCSTKKGFMVTLGFWAGQNGTVRDGSGTLIHELGHDLGLGHGGGDGVNFKPNYLSVMNYRYQTIGIPDWDAWAALAFASDQIVNVSTIDYSRAALSDLDETALDENVGIGDGNVAAYWVDPARALRAGDGRLALDWNWSNNGLAPFQNPVIVDLNGDRVCVTSGDDGTLDTAPTGDDVVQAGAVTTGPDRDCDTAKTGDDKQDRAVGFVQPDDLTGFDDWANIKWRAAMSPDAGSPGPLGFEELTFELSELIKAAAIEAVNQPPVADADGPYMVNEGSTVLLDGTGSSDPDGDPLTYLWSPATHLDDPTIATPTYSGVDDTVDTLTLTVSDPGGLFDSDTTTVTVLNVNPTVTATGDSIDEAGTATVTATFTDPGVLDTHTAKINWGDGTPLESVAVTQGAGSGSLSGSHVYGDNSTYTVTVAVTDDDSGAGSDPTSVLVANLVPDVTLDTTEIVSFPGGDAFVGRIGIPQDHDASATDPGSDDLTFSWNFGPAATYFNDGVGPDPLPSPAGTFPFMASDDATVSFGIPGLELIQVTATDDDGGADIDSAAKLFTGDADQAFGSGYWGHQYSGNGQPQLDEATLEGYLEIINFVSTVFSEQTTATTLAEAAAVLSPRGDDKRAVATADLLTAWLHFASGVVSHDAMVPIQGQQVPYLDVMSEIEAIVLDPTATRAELLHASFLAQRAMQGS